MKHPYLKTLLLCLCMFASINAFAEAVEIDGIYYNLVTKIKEAEVTKKPSGYYSGSVNIPETVSYNNVTYSVTSIGNHAFAGCSDLVSISVPSTLYLVKEGAFFGCTSLSKVIVTDIAAWCGITYEGDDYNGDFPLGIAHHLYSDEDTEITEIIIPEGVTHISARAFRDAKHVTSITIPNSVTTIDYEAFCGMHKLSSIHFHPSI